MNELEFKDKWEKDKPVYEAWGKHIVKAITKEITNQGKNGEIFFKIEPKFRLKTDTSLIDKAFYRPEKKYDDPYNQIEDKVGVRFVVLLLDDIELVSKVIESGDWSFDRCRHFESDREKNPTLFTYQSVHYILRPKNTIETEDGIMIPTNIPCEVQVRTLLQHAHAELTHDAIYKSKKEVSAKVQRTTAKCMALIETTDQFFAEATKELNYGRLQEFKITDRLDNLYETATRLKPYSQKSSLYVWDAFQDLIEYNLPDQILRLLDNEPYLAEKIREQYSKHSFYQQSIALFIYWLLKRKRNRLLKDWPLDREILERFATDIGVSLQPD